MSQTQSAVRVRGLQKRYPGARGASEVVAVGGIDLDIGRGEVFALLGPNGAGKSTTIEMLTGFRRRTSGEASVLGLDPDRATREWRSRIGLVPQATGAAGTATVRETISHVASLYPRSRDVDAVIEAVGLTEKARERIASLSGGQQRRVDVALSVIGDPELLFLDEPTTGFDPAARRQFWDLIRGLSDGGTTIVLTTHYLDEAAALSQRAGVIARGELVDVAPIDEIGSADSRVPIVRWRDRAGVQQEVRTHEPGATVRALAEHGEPDGLEIVRPSLEDVYLDLIGHGAAPDTTAAADATGTPDTTAAADATGTSDSTAGPLGSTKQEASA